MRRMLLACLVSMALAACTAASPPAARRPPGPPPVLPPEPVLRIPWSQTPPAPPTIDAGVTMAVPEDLSRGYGPIGPMRPGRPERLIYDGRPTEWHPAPSPPPWHATAQLGTLMVTGTLEPSAVRRRLVEARAYIEACYREELVDHESFAGTAVVAFTIQRDGRLLHVDASGLGNATVERCIEDSVRALHFEASGPGDALTRGELRLIFER